MNCRNFETVISELARGQMLEARTREDALAHVEVCKHCATRFADEQSLTAGLLEVAASATLIETPVRVEAALLAAFRQDATKSTNVDAFTQAKMPRWSPWFLAAAATILVVAAFGVLQLLSNNTRDAAHRQAITTKPTPLSSTVEEIAGQSNPEAPPAPAVKNPEQGLIPASQFPQAMDRRRGLIRDARLNERPVHSANNLENAASANGEIATDFMPLTYGSNLSQLDDGQVVRVELSRSVLQSFGFPINAERAGERVKADVLLGHDGVARAIRFIR
ncbi:MAG TPA: hypothetical protein VGN95_03230 [Pyrinomonadaceae bacterium]|jgi:negative regulator of sigma E activity|nr:hypothetical protein [Pyrinomonadaceae bacterium]